MCSILAELYEDLGQLDDAEEMAGHALYIFDKTFGATDISAIEAAATLGLLYAKQSKLNTVEIMWERAMRDSEETKGPDHPSTM
jgi:tetratricopeptide (TPR) repeat protein